MKLFFCFDGNFDEGVGEGYIAEPKYAFRTKAACERYLAIKLKIEGKGRGLREGDDRAWHLRLNQLVLKQPSKRFKVS